MFLNEQIVKYEKNNEFAESTKTTKSEVHFTPFALTRK